MIAQRVLMNDARVVYSAGGFGVTDRCSRNHRNDQLRPLSAPIEVQKLSTMIAERCPRPGKFSRLFGHGLLVKRNEDW